MKPRGLRSRRPTRRGMMVSLAALALVVFTVGGIVQIRVDTDIGSFLPSDDPALQSLEDKARSFGGDPIIVLLESPQPRQLLLGENQLPSLLKLEGSLSRLPDVGEVYGPGTVLNQVAISGQNLLAQISGRRDGLRKAEEQQARSAGANDRAASAAGQEALSSFDRRYGSLIVSALPTGLPTLGNPRFVDSVVFGSQEQLAQSRPQWKGIVPTPNTAAVLVRPRAKLDQAGTSRLVESVRSKVAESGLRTSRTTVTGVPAVTAALTERAQQEFPLLGALALAVVGLLYLFVPWSTRRRSRLRPLLAAFLGTTLTLAGFGWLNQSLSLGVVAFLPILLGIGSDFPLYLAQPARRRRVLVAALAGAAGFGSLALSSLPFVRELGVALAIGILVTVAVALVLRRRFDVLQPVETSTQWDTGEPVRRSWRVRLPVLIAALAAAAVGWTALPQVDIEARPDKLAEGLPALDQAEYAEGVLGASGEINVSLHGPDVLTPAALNWQREAEGVINREYADKIHPITTVSNLLQFLGPQPTPEQIQAAMDLLPSYLSSAVIRPDRRTSLMVLGIELQPVAQQRQLLDGLQSALPPPPSGYQANVVGLPVAAARGYEAVSEGRVTTNLLAVGLAGLVLFVGLRERRDAGRAVLTILLSSGWVLALAWAVTGSLSPLTVAIGALTTATGSEFAVMLADARRSRRSWLLRSVGLAALAAVGGYLALAVSDLAILRDFGLLLAAGVVTSCLAAFTVVGLLVPPTEHESTTAPRFGIRLPTLRRKR